MLKDTENNDFLILHVNAVSLEKRHGSIKAMLARLEKSPSIFFVSDARLSNDKNALKTQIPKIELDGYHTPVFCTSPYSAGGVAIYVSEDLIFHERSDIQFNAPDCESCFVEIECNDSKNNPVFGAMYRHGFTDANLFNEYLRQFLEKFTDKGIRLTLLGDINLNLLNSHDSAVKDYKNVLNSVGFSPLINKPTRIFRDEGSDEVSSSCLDHILSNDYDNFSEAGILISDVSDHLPIFGNIHISNPKQNLREPILKRSFPEHKKIGFLKC